MILGYALAGFKAKIQLSISESGSIKYEFNEYPPSGDLDVDRNRRVMEYQWALDQGDQLVAIGNFGCSEPGGHVCSMGLLT